MSGMAEVLAVHHADGGYNYDLEWQICTCGTSYAPRTHDTHVEQALTSAGFGSVADALEDAAARFDIRSETLLKTMQNMAGHPDTTPDDVVRYGAYSAESNTTATWLRTRAAEMRKP